MNVSFVPPDQINYIWGTVGALLAPAVVLTNGRYLVEDVRVGILNGTMQLWITFDNNNDIIMCVVTKVSEYPSRKILCIMFAGGKNPQSCVGEVIGILERWGRDNKCSGIEYGGRKGWIRLLEPYGFKRNLDTYEKDL
jgi:hypothetical protein